VPGLGQERERSNQVPSSRIGTAPGTVVAHAIHRVRIWSTGYLSSTASSLSITHTSLANPFEVAMSTPESPLPGDFVIRRSERRGGVRISEEWVVCTWPHTHIVLAGPYESYAYAFLRATELRPEPSRSIWRNHGPAGKWERLQLVSAGFSDGSDAPRR
jgi:hypothetical protein